MRALSAGRLLIVAVLALATASAAADTIVKTEGGSGEAEVCRFRADEGDDPFHRWLSSQDVTCVPSGSSMSFPKGRWNVFGRASGGVSVEPIVIDSVKAPETLTVSLLPAAMLSVQLPADHTAVLYAPKSVTAFPASERMLVPAEQELWLFVLAKSVPVAVVVIPPIAAGSERVIDSRTLAIAPAVVGWVQLPEADRVALKKARGVMLPHIRLTSAKKEVEALSLPAPEALDGAFVLLTGLSEGDLRLTGRGWLPLSRRISAGPEPLTVVRQPIVARASATLVVNWSTYGDLQAIDRSIGTCEQPPPPTRFELIISSCAEQKPGKGIDPAACHPIRTEALVPAETFGSVTIEEVPPGVYRAELHFGKLPPAAETTTLAPLDVNPLQLQARYLEAYGSLTRGGKPLSEDARIEFPRGTGFSPHDSGEYRAALLAPFGDDSKIDIVGCQSGQRVFVLADKPFLRSAHARYDLDIPDNVLTVTVVDTFTRAPLTSAVVKCAVMSSRAPRRPVVIRVLNSGNAEAGQGTAEGEEPAGEGQAGGAQFVMKAVPEREIRIHVTNTGYKPQEIDPFTMPKSGTKDIEVQLVPVGGSQGKIDSARSFEKAMLFWFSPDGVETERADVAPDGTFYYDQPHLRGETMTLVSVSHPLWITGASSADRGKILEVNFPDAAPVRAADVVIPNLPDRAVTLVGVAIAGLRVPTPALAQHLALRALEPLVHGGGPLHVPDLAESGPIDFLRGPFVQLPMRGPVVGNFVPTAIKRLEPGADKIWLDGRP